MLENIVLIALAVTVRQLLFKLCSKCIMITDNLLTDQVMISQVMDCCVQFAD